MLLYLDPGTGSLIIQVIIAAFATIVVRITYVRNFLATIFKSKKIILKQDIKLDD